MRLPISFEPRYGMGLQIPNSYRILDAGGSWVCDVGSSIDAQFLCNLLNLTTEEMQDKARAALYREAAE